MMYQNFIQKIGSKRRVAFHAAVIAILIYFIFHAIAGNRGVIAYFKLNQKMEKSGAELDTLRVERVELEHRVNLLKPPLDKDMLDEQARKTLGVAAPSEKVFVVEEKSVEVKGDKQ